MKIIIITSEGYGCLNEHFSHGENHFLVEDDQAKEVLAKFEAWREQLGLCPGALPTEQHSLSCHVYADVRDVKQLPAFLQTPEGVTNGS